MTTLWPRGILALGALALAGGGSALAAADAANLAFGRTVSLSSVRGEAAAVTDGRLAVEGGPAAEDAVTFEGVTSAVVIDLGAERSIRAWLLQATAADVFFVETSTDSATWHIAWRRPPVQNVSLMRTRTVILPRAVSARWLRVRPTTSVHPAVAELMAFAEEPVPWPPLELGLPTGPLPRWPALTTERIAILNTAAAAVFLLVAAWLVLGRSDDGRIVKIRRLALMAAAALALVSWPNFLDFHRYTVVHKWDVFHYYIGGKYLPELGYTRLYACSAVVDAEDGIDLRGQVMRDLRDNTAVAVESELARAGECRARFSPRRWEAFRQDIRFFREAMGERRFASLRIDHGYNGTPAWAVLGGLLARLSPASWTQIRFLVALDFLLLAAMFFILARSFGLEAACLAAGFFGTNALAPFGWTGGAFLRYDWLLALTAGVAALKEKRPALAGFALGTASLLRVFPVFAIVGVAVGAAAQAFRARSARPLARHAPLAAGIALATVLITALSMWAGGGPDIWGEFLDNSAKHATTPMSNTIGLAVVLGHGPETRLEVLTDPLLPNDLAVWEERVASSDRRTTPLRWAAVLGFLVLLARVTRSAPEWSAAVLGLGLMPLALKLSSYYYSALTLYAALATVHGGVGLALASLAWLTNVVHGLWSFPDDRHFGLSLLVLVFVLGTTIALARGTRLEKDGARRSRR